MERGVSKDRNKGLFQNLMLLTFDNSDLDEESSPSAVRFIPDEPITTIVVQARP